MADFDLDAYLARIGYAGPLRPDFETLSGIEAAHVEAIPFEGLDPLLGRPVSLDLAALQAKLVNGGRGGYCFEQNAVFRAALETIGFSVTGLGARVMLSWRPGQPLGPRGHMALRIDLDDGPWLADVGLGLRLQDAPIRLKPDDVQETPGSIYRLDREGETWTLNYLGPNGWRPAYCFTLEPQLQSDYELANWFFASHPMSPFTQVVVVQKMAPEGRLTLVNRRFTTGAREGPLKERTIADAGDFADVLTRVFGLEPPVPAGEIYERIASAPEIPLRPE